MSSYRFSDNTVTPLLGPVAVSGTNTYTAGPVKVIDFQTYTFQLEWSGTPTGTITILGSLDGINFRQFGATVSAQPAGTPNGTIAPLYGHGMKYLEITYVNASGSGTLTVTGLGKTR